MKTFSLFFLISFSGCLDAEFLPADSDAALYRGADAGTEPDIQADTGTPGIDAGAPDIQADIGTAPDVQTTPDAQPDAETAVPDAQPDLGPPDTGPDTGPHLPQPTLNQVVFTEIMYDSKAALAPAGLTPDDVGEWVELFNASTESFDLFGCNLSDSKNTDTITTHLVLAPGALVTLSRSAPGFIADFVYANVKFSDTGDIARLSCGTAVIDAVNFTTGFVLSQGYSLSLDPGHILQNDDPASWCAPTKVYNITSRGSDFGTPGVKNDPCP